MKTIIQIQSIPDANPIPNATIAVRSLVNGGILDTITSDDDGFALLQRDGHLEPYYFHITGQPGGDKFWRSDEMMTAGPTSPQDWPIALLPLGNGVIAGYEGELEVTVNGLLVTIQPGAAIVAGHPFVQYNVKELTAFRPDSGFRIDAVVVEVYPGGSATTPGKSQIAWVIGEANVAAVPDLIQTATVYQMPIGLILVQAAGTLVSALGVRQFLQPERHEPVTDEVALDGPIVTDESGGEALPGLEIVLDLPDEGIYDITARLSATQGPVAGSTNWTNTATYLAYPNWPNGIQVTNPGQVAIGSSGRILIADTGNNRLVILSSDGSFYSSIPLTGITGVCVDASFNIYVALPSSIKKYSSAFSLQWTYPSDGTLVHCATDGTHVYVTDSGFDMVRKFLCSTGAPVTTFGTLDAPWGIAYKPSTSHVVVVDSGNNQIVRFSTAGAIQSVVSLYAGMRGIAIDSTGDEWIARYADDMAYSIGGDSFAQPNPDGIAFASGDVAWVNNASDGTIAKWDEITTASGYGQLAIDTDSDLGTYVGPGNRDAPIKTVKTWTSGGGYGVQSVIRAFGKATTGEATFKSLVLSAEARPRR